MKATTEVVFIGYKEGLTNGKKWQYITVLNEHGQSINLFGDVEKFKEAKPETKQLIELNITRYLDNDSKKYVWGVKVC